MVLSRAETACDDHADSDCDRPSILTPVCPPVVALAGYRTAQNCGPRYPSSLGLAEFEALLLVCGKETTTRWTTGTSGHLFKTGRDVNREPLAAPSAVRPPRFEPHNARQKL
jgi:hypothetical protein